jgi:hypothetical protein
MTGTDSAPVSVAYFPDMRDHAIWIETDGPLSLQLSPLACGEFAFVLFRDRVVTSHGSDVLTCDNTHRDAVSLEELVRHYPEFVPLLTAGMDEALLRLAQSAHIRLTQIKRLNDATGEIS